MIHSLKFRLLISFIAVIMVTIGTVYLFISRSATSEIGQFGQRSEAAHSARLLHSLSRYYHEQGEQADIQTFVIQMAGLYERRIVLTDRNNVVIADSEEKLIGKPYYPSSADRTILLPPSPPPPRPPSG